MQICSYFFLSSAAWFISESPRYQFSQALELFLHQQSCGRARQSGTGPGEERSCPHVVGELLSQKVSAPVSSQTERDQTGQAEGEVPGPPLSAGTHLLPALVEWL